MSINRSTASAAPTRAAEAGTAVVGTLVGFAIFLTLLLFSAQVLVRLYATSAVTSAATRAAETVADSPDPPAEVAVAEAQARSQLGSFGSSRTSFRWKEVDDQQVVLEVVATSPAFLPGPHSWERITRTVTVRTERFRP
jgi:hypothetical protein